MSLKSIPHDSKRGVWVVLLDDEPWKQVHQSIFGKSPKIERENFDEQELKRAKNFALRRLTQKNYSSFEMKTLLKDRCVSEPAIHQILDELQQLGYINDHDWIIHFINSYMRKKHGPRSIAMKLKAKKVPDEMIQKYLFELESNCSQSERIQALLETKFAKRDLTNFKEKQKVIASLLRKGFDYEQVSHVLKNDFS